MAPSLHQLPQVTGRIPAFRQGAPIKSGVCFLLLLFTFFDINHCCVGFIPGFSALYSRLTDLNRRGIVGAKGFMNFILILPILDWLAICHQGPPPL